MLANLLKIKFWPGLCFFSVYNQYMYYIEIYQNQNRVSWPSIIIIIITIVYQQVYLLCIPYTQYMPLMERYIL